MHKISLIEMMRQRREELKDKKMEIDNDNEDLIERMFNSLEGKEATDEFLRDALE